MAGKHSGNDHRHGLDGVGTGGKRATGEGADIYGDNPTSLADEIASEGMTMAKESHTNDIHGLDDASAGDTGGDEEVQERE